MASGTKDGRYMPALAVLLLGTLGITAWWLYQLSFGPAGKPAAVEVLLNAQAASLQADNALEGDTSAFAALRTTSEALKDITTTSLGESQRNVLGEVRRVVGG